MFPIIITSVFVVGYVLIAMEHKWNLHKAITAASLGGLLWFLVALHENGSFPEDATAHIGSDIFNLIIFLLAAMTLIEVMAHYRFFDYVKAKILKLNFDNKKQFWVIVTLAFFLSAVLDNLTTTIVMIEIARSFFKGKNLLLTGGAVVISANAGGAWSPIGDVTTIMLWLDGKFNATEIISWAFLPSLFLFFVSSFMLSFSISGEKNEVSGENVKLLRSEKAIIILCFVSFFFPVLFSQLGLEPYFGLLFGLGLVGLIIALFRKNTRKNLSRNEDSAAGLDQISSSTPGHTHLTVDFEKKLSKVDLASLLFFTGILLAVGALEHIGILHLISESLFGPDPSISKLVIGNAFIGIFSALVDNIPLTAATMSIITSTDPTVWVLLALTAGTGGSLLVIGSAAGVVAMGKVKELSFGAYLKYITFPAFVGYVVAVLVWIAEYSIFR
jgi:Na+/H+ antiporter NhaD/arsenite permease-like protein